MLRILAITLIALAGVSAAHADVYRWVDSNGVVQYSDRWVPGSVLVKQDKSRPSASASSAPAAPAATPTAVPTSRANEILAREQDQRTVAADAAKARDENCKKARVRLSAIMGAQRPYRAQPDGERHYLSAEEIDAEIKDAEEGVTQWCSR